MTTLLGHLYAGDSAGIDVMEQAALRHYVFASNARRVTGRFYLLILGLSIWLMAFSEDRNFVACSQPSDTAVNGIASSPVEKVDSVSARVYRLRFEAQELAGKGRYTQATEAISKAIKIDPSNPALYDYRASLWRELGRYNDALKDAGIAIRFSPNDANLLNSRGRTFFLKGNNKAAIDDFTAALSVSPADVLFLTNRALAFSNILLTKEAMQDIDQALRCQPWNIRTVVTRAQILKRSGQPGKAKTSLEQFLADWKASGRFMNNPRLLDVTREIESSR